MQKYRTFFRVFGGDAHLTLANCYLLFLFSFICSEKNFEQSSKMESPQNTIDVDILSVDNNYLPSLFPDSYLDLQPLATSFSFSSDTTQDDSSSEHSDLPDLTGRDIKQYFTDIQSEESSNSVRCRKYRRTKKEIKQQEKEELKILKYNNTLLRRKESEMAKKLKAARDIYLRCIQSGKIKFMI